MAESTAADSLYDRLGGNAYFHRLVAAFYDGVESNSVLRPLYPEDLDPPRERLALFLIQQFGGPNDYEALRGPAKLRLRHLEFAIDTVARDAWLAEMQSAIVATQTPEPEATELVAYFTKMAAFLVNRGLAIGGTT